MLPAKTLSIPKIVLMPGDLHMSETPVRLETLVGSCLAVTYYAPLTQWGAMCHAVMPKGEIGGRYVNMALTQMWQWFSERGVLPGQLEVRLFGGGDVLLADLLPGPSIGQRNIREAWNILARLGLSIKGGHMGGAQGRKISFHTHSGELTVKLVPTLQQTLEKYNCK